MEYLQLHQSVVTENDRVEYEKEGRECISLKKVADFLNANKSKDVTFDIASLGGDLDAAIAISNLIKAHKGKTIADVTGLTASAGTVIADSCDEVRISENALFLIHNGWQTSTGNIYDFKKTVDNMAKTDSIMVKLYKEKSGLPEEKIIELMKIGDWMTPAEAKEYGFVDVIYEPEIKIAASALIEGAQGKIDNLLLTKLKAKMNLFGKKGQESAKTIYPLALADDTNLVMSAEVVAKGVEVMPLGGNALADGEYELASGEKIVIKTNADGVQVVEEMKEKEEPTSPAGEDILSTVAKMLVDSEAKTKALIEETVKPLQAMVTKHTPPKTQPVANAGSAEADELQAKVEAKMAEQRKAAEAKRQGR